MSNINIYYGVPGVGKSTYAAKIVRDNLKKGIKTFCNFRVKGAYLFDVLQDFGIYDISECEVIIDEAGLSMNNRNWKSFPDTCIYAFKMYRHFDIKTIHIFSQAFDDCDITVRRLTTKTYLLTKIPFTSIICIRRIEMYNGIDEVTHKPATMYKFKIGFPKLVWGRRYWKYFNSFERIKLKEKEFELVT